MSQDDRPESRRMNPFRRVQQRLAGRTPEEVMHDFLTGESKGFARARRVFKHVPSSPHCKLCAAPFAGAGGAVFGRVGFARFAGNPAICNSCIKGLQKVGVFGAEIPVTLLFADIRGSTTIGERMEPTGYRAFLDHFYRISSETILAHDGLVDKFVGDEVIGLFFEGISGDDHAADAVAAAQELLGHAGRSDATPSGPIPLGAGVHGGTAFVGSTGSDGAVNDFTALGDVVNTTARLASEASAGELVISVDAAGAAGLDPREHERRTLKVRGRTEPIDVLSVRAGHATPAGRAH